MRGSILSLVLVFLAGTVISCAPSQGPSTAGSHGDTHSCYVNSDGKAVLRLTVPAGAKTFDKTEPLTVVEAQGFIRFYVWAVNGARTLDEAAARVPEVIKSEFKDFKLTGTKELAVLGAPARQLTGSGAEADDGDPGNAEVVLFTVGGRVFAACIHGEGNPTAAAHDFMMAMLQTAKTP